MARGPSREPAPYRYDPVLLKTVPRDFLEDATACVLYAGTTHLVEADGTVETVSHEVTRLGGRKGIEKVGEYRNIVYTPSYQKLTLNEARIHKPDGIVVAVRPRDVHLRDVGTDFQSYDPDKQLIITFPTLEVGDVIEVKWTVRGKNPEHAGHFFTRYSFGDPSYPVVLDELRVRLPREKALKFGCSPGKLEPAVSEADGLRTYHWKMPNCRQLPRDEDLPSREELRPSVLCSTFTSWKEVGAWKQRLRESCWKCTPAISAVVSRVTRDCKTPAEKARALTYWVRRNIRYVSVGERHDYTPHPPETVLANRFGDCKDGSQLLAVMLREAGLRVELATLGVLDDGQVDPDVPSPWGTHAILLVSIDGKEHWIDTTSRLSRWDELPKDDRERLCYLTDDKGQTRLVRTPPLKSEDQRWQQLTEMWIGTDGTSRCLRKAEAYGSGAVAQRDRYLEVPPGERRRVTTAALQDAHSRSLLVGLRVDEKALQDFDSPVLTQVEFEIGRHFTGKEELEGSVTDSKVWGKLLAHNLDPERKVALVLYAPFESTHTYVFHLPPTHVLDEMPRDKTLRSKWGTFEVKARALDAKEPIRNLEVTFVTKIEKVRVEPADFDDFRRFHEDVNREYRVWLTLKPASDRGSAELLEAYLAFVPQDVRAAGALARIYYTSGKAAEAGRVLKRARRYLPEDAKLLELAVKYADGFAAEEEAQRELVKRFPDEVKHKLALAAVLVTRGKQKEAREILQPLTKTGPGVQRAQAHYQLARSHYRKDELKEALAELDAAGKEDAEAVTGLRPLMLKGQLLEELGRPQGALAAYKLAWAQDRENQEVLLSLIRLAIVADQKPEAVEYLKRYSLLVEKDVNGLLLAAETYLKLGRPDDAFDLATKAREQGFHEKAQRIMGLVYLQKGEDARALRHLQNADADAVVLAALMKVYLNLGNLREACSCMEKAGRLEKPTPALQKAIEMVKGVQARRAHLREVVNIPAGKEGEWSGALDAVACAEDVRARGRPRAVVESLLERAFGEGLAIGPAYALRARLALERGRLLQALPDAEEAVKLSPKDASGYYVRGRVALERGVPGAVPDLEKAVALTGRRDVDTLAALAEALYVTGQKAKALQVQKEAVKLRPGDRELVGFLGRLEREVK